MLFGEINLFFFVFFFMLLSIVINVTTSLHLLLTAEFLWVNLYILSLFIAISYDNINILSLTFFLLILSAVEFGIGLVVILIQNLLFRSIRLSDNSSNFSKFSTRFFNKINRGSFRLYNN